MQQAKAFNLIPKKLIALNMYNVQSDALAFVKNGQVDIYVIYIFTEK